MSKRSAALSCRIYPYRIHHTAGVLSHLCQSDRPHMPAREVLSALCLNDPARNTHVALHEDFVRPSSASTDETHAPLTELCPLWWGRSRDGCRVTRGKIVKTRDNDGYSPWPSSFRLCLCTGSWDSSDVAFDSPNVSLIAFSTASRSFAFRSSSGTKEVLPFLVAPRRPDGSTESDCRRVFRFMSIDEPRNGLPSLSELPTIREGVADMSAWPKCDLALVERGGCVSPGNGVSGDAGPLTE